ncbi:MAG TPA: hypothetical protein VEV43_07885, partial [Actinomycetota bacterium]|nr:hypothetical protein [Actinomycetota bacterium]
MRRVALVLLTGLVVAASTGAAPANPCPGVTAAGSWKTIETPMPTAAFTVDPAGRIFVAGGRTIAVSIDGGCAWADALRINELVPGPVGERRVTSLATVGRSVVGAVTGGPFVVVSNDGGETWRVSSIGLDVPGDPAGLYAAGGVVYLLVRREATDETVAGPGVSAAVTVVYRSDDGGVTWTRGDAIATAYTGPQGSGVEGASAPGAVWDLAVDPGDPDHVLAASRGGVFRSVDGGRSWASAMPEPGSDVRAVTIWRTGAVPAAAAVDPSSGTLYEGDVVAGTWRRKVVPRLRTEMMTQAPNAAAWAWAAAKPSGELFLSGPNGVFRVAGRTLADVTPPGTAEGTVAGVRVFGGAVWGRLLDGSALVTQVGLSAGRPGGDSPAGAGTPGGDPIERAIARLPDPPVPGGRAHLEPGAKRVELAPGETRAVKFEARLGPRPVDLDLYFLVDTTASMSRTIRGLREGLGEIVLRLARSRIRLRVGVGAFRTYPRETDGASVEYAYRRMRALGPLDSELLRVLYELDGAGSSGANLTALYQAVTGAGQDVLPPGPSNADVPAGGEAGFREGAMKVVVHFADTWFGTPERGDPTNRYPPGTWPGPPMETAADALRDEGVMHLGVALQPAGSRSVIDDADVVQDMRTMSRATSSFAGARGVDCDGDAEPDVPPGEALVCLLDRDADAGGVASVVTGLVKAIERRGDVRLAEARESALVRAISPPVHGEVDLRVPQRLAFDVTVGCRRSDAGTNTAGFDLLVAGARVAGSSLDVVCTEPPAPALSTRPDTPSPSALAAIPPIPVLPPPHPVPGPGPGSVTAPAPVQAPAPAQAPGGQPSATVVAQRQQQPQVAFVTAVQQVREQTQMQHAFVRTRSRDPLAAARLWTAVGA